MRKRGRGGVERQRKEGEGGKWVGGRTRGATRNSYQLIIIERGGKKSWQTRTENWHVFLEAGSSKLKRQI